MPGAIFVLANERIYFRHIGGSGWTDIGHCLKPRPGAFAALDGFFYCVGEDNQMWRRPAVPYEVNWTVVGPAQNVVGLAGCDGRIFGAASDNKLWYAPAGTANWVECGNADNVRCLGADVYNRVIYGCNTENKIWKRGVDNPNWVMVGDSTDTVGVGCCNGRLFGCTSQNDTLWTKMEGEPSWNQAGTSDGKFPRVFGLATLENF